jgi:hypothetical protein
MGERRVDTGWGSARYIRCTVYKVLDTVTGQWVHEGSRKPAAVAAMKSAERAS